MTTRASIGGAALLIVVLAHPTTASAQAPTPPSVLGAEDLKTPSTPAATILGSSPTTIERPDNPRGLIFSIASSVASSGGVPQDYAVQVAPYWMRSHPMLMFDSYINPTIGQSLLRSFAISVATADWTGGSGGVTDLGSRLAIGTSAVILSGRVDPKLTELRDAIVKSDGALILLLRARDNDPRLKGLNTRLTDLKARLASETDPTNLVEVWRAINETTSTIEAVTLDWNRKIASLEQTVKDMTAQIETMNVERFGLRLMAAAAWSIQISNDVFADTSAERAGFWATPSYRMRLVPGAGSDPGARPRFVDALGVVRFLRHRVDDTTAWDIGGRVVWEATDSVSLSAEAVQRMWSADSLTENSLRAVGSFEVKLADRASLFATFGRDFTEAEVERNLVSIVGLKLGFGEKPVLAVR